MAHKIPALPYAFNALEPHIDAKTMEIHHDKHHAAYVSKLNAAIEGQSDLASKSIEELVAGVASLPDKVRTAEGGLWLTETALEGPDPSDRSAAAVSVWRVGATLASRPHSAKQAVP